MMKIKENIEEVKEDKKLEELRKKSYFFLFILIKLRKAL